MIRFETEQTIGRSAEDVWAYAADIRLHPEWMGVIDARIVQGNGTEVGARALERITMGGRTIDVAVAVSESIPARRIGWTVTGDSRIAGAVTLQLDPLGPDRTRAVWSGQLGLTGMWRLIEPFMARDIRNGEAAELKANLETSPNIA
jgi:uncharacterized membrane protein